MIYILDLYFRRILMPFNKGLSKGKRDRKNIVWVISNLYTSSRGRGFLMLYFIFLSFLTFEALRLPWIIPRTTTSDALILKNDKPAYANRFPVYFGFGWDFFAFPKCQRIFFNAAYCLKYFIPNTNSIDRLVFNVGNITRNVVNILECMIGYP